MVWWPAGTLQRTWGTSHNSSFHFRLRILQNAWQVFPNSSSRECWRVLDPAGNGEVNLLLHICHNKKLAFLRPRIRCQKCFVPQCSFCIAPTHPRQKSDHKEVKIVPISAVWQESYFLHKLIYKYSKSRRAILKNNNWFVKDFPRRSDLPLVDARGSDGGGGPGSDVWVSRREDRGGQAHLPPLDPRRSWAACLRLLWCSSNICL